ncbi:MAG: siderophore-interacting protein [Pseudomonadota bacterium]
MPRMNKWLADRMERAFSSQFHPVDVVEIEQIGERLRRVRFAGDLSATSYAPGYVIEFRITDVDFRHYTPAYYDAERGLCDVLFYLHDKGVGSAWAANLEVGQRVTLMGPGNKMTLRDGARHLLFGDETAIGLCAAMTDATQRSGAQLHSLLELDATHWAWPVQLGLEVTLLDKDPNSTAARDWFAQQSEADWQRLRGAQFYLVGRARSIQAIKQTLRARGVARRQIQSAPYWAEGKNGL